MRNVGQPVSLAKALWRGFTMRCPNCGEGKLFGRFLKVADRCAVCGEDLTPQRADDFPAYLVIVVIGHITIPAVLVVEEAFAPPLWLQYLIWLPFIAFGALTLLQPAKGTVVALQWQLGMHGFARAKELRDIAAATGRKPFAETAVSA
ncbi:MAG: DUF983 domain-containing protein [Xanthobacteraceae bacterium]|jgi:uncharacterized protein (DUF983 family)